MLGIFENRGLEITQIIVYYIFFWGGDGVLILLLRVFLPSHLEDTLTAGWCCHSLSVSKLCHHSFSGEWLGKVI